MGKDDASGSVLGTPYAAAIVVLGAMGFLLLVARGFRGVSVGGVSVGVR